MNEIYDSEELLNEIYENYYSISIKGLGEIAGIEIKFKESSKLSAVHVERVGELSNIVVFYRTPQGYVFYGSLIKQYYALILSASIATIKMTERESLRMNG